MTLKKGDILIENTPASQIAAEAIKRGWARLPYAEAYRRGLEQTELERIVELERELSELKRLGK